MTGERARAILLTLAAATLWGTSFLVNDAGLNHVPARAFVLLRFLLAAPCVLAAAWALERASGAALLRHRSLWVLGALNGLAFLLQYLAQERTTPARTALLVNSSVVLVAAFSWALLRERPTRAQGWAVIAAVAGVTLFITDCDPSRLRGGTLSGDALALAAGVAWALFFVLGKRALDDAVPPLALSAALVTVSTVLLLPVGAPQLLALSAVPWDAWLAVAYVAAGCTALAYALWAWGLRSVSPTTSSVLLLAEVPVAGALSVALGAESATTWGVMGAVLLFGSMLAVASAPAAPGAPAAAPGETASAGAKEG